MEWEVSTPHLERENLIMITILEKENVVLCERLELPKSIPSMVCIYIRPYFMYADL